MARASFAPQGGTQPRREASPEGGGRMIIGAAALSLAAAASTAAAPSRPDLPVCGPRVESACRVPDALTAAEARALLGGRASAWRLDNGTLQVVAAGDGPLDLCCTFQAPLRPTPGAA